MSLKAADSYEADQDLALAFCTESCALLTAFAFAVIDSHPKPRELEQAFRLASQVSQRAVGNQVVPTAVEQARDMVNKLSGQMTQRMVMRSLGA